MQPVCQHGLSFAGYKDYLVLMRIKYQYGARNAGAFDLKFMHDWIMSSIG